MLNKAKILIVEDEAIIAMHLATIVEDFDGEVVGPISSVAEALELLALGTLVEGAVLDGNLGDGDITPVAIRLVEHAIPLIIYSCVGVAPELAEIHPDLPVVLKPAAADRAVILLAARMAGEAKVTTS